MKFNAYLENCRQAICDCIDNTEELGKSIMRRDLIFALHELDSFRHGRLQTCEHCADEEFRPGQTENQSQPEPPPTPKAECLSEIICPDGIKPRNLISFVETLIRLQANRGTIVGLTSNLFVDGKSIPNPTGEKFQLIFEKTPPSPGSMSFTARLTQAINACSMENGSNTPDFILAEYLEECLAAFNVAVKHRERWYGRGPKICPAPITAANPNYVTPKE